MRMRNFKYIILATITLMCGCSKGILPEIGGDNTPDGMVRVSIDAHAEMGSEVLTRATDTDITGNIVALVFDSKDITTAKLKQAPVVGTVNGNNIDVMLYEEKTASFICLLANITNENKAYLLALKAGATLMEISSQTTTQTVTPLGISAPFPMSGWSASITDIKKATPSTISIVLTRIVARIDVNGVPSGFKIHGVRLSNGAKRGYVIPQQMLPYFGANDVVVYNQVTLATPGTSLKEQIYCYENRSIQGNSVLPTRIVIYGERAGVSTGPSYYGVDIVYPEAANSNVFLNYVQRNKIYTVNLNRVEAEGYLTYEDAVKAEPFNNIIEADIVVTDPSAFDVTTNGKQYLGLTNSEFVLYPAESGVSTSDVSVATISYTCADNWGIGKVEASSGIELIEGVKSLEVQSGSTPIYRDIIVKRFDPTFKAGTIKIEIGNLIKVITVRANMPTMPSGQVNNDYFAAPNTKENYKFGEIISPSTQTSWLKVSTLNVAEGSSALSDKVTNVDGGIYFHVQPFLERGTGISIREASLFVTGERSDQRIKILVRQHSADQYFKQLTPYSYVGTFHRWNQTAERVITLNAAGAGWWRASVVSGDDFIVLSTSGSNDGGVSKNMFGVGNAPNFTSDEQIEQNCQLNSRLTTVTGTGSQVYFRVGLTSQLSGARAQPRYGMVIVSYGTGDVLSGSHRIFVRQGEAADYIMKPSEKSTSAGFNNLTRPKAVRIAPYNLTDVLTPTVGVDFEDRGTQGYNFVQYPSQGGFYFAASGTQAIRPTASGVVTGLTAPTFDINNPFNVAWQVCPNGYRRPNDGQNRAYTTADGANDVIGSELRQSLWLNPSKGAEKYDHDNHLVGFIADGYFDRRPVVAPNSTVANLTNSVVAKGTVDAAYAGALIFNPNTNASVFIPYSGVYEGGVKEQGTWGAMQVSTAGATSDKGWAFKYGHFSTQSKFAITTGSRDNALHYYSIRCVRDENPTTGTDDSQVEKPGEGEKQKLVSILYDNAKTGTLQEQLEAIYPNESDRKLITDFALHATKTMTADDYKYLNDWASKADHRLSYLILRGSATLTIPTNAINSDGWIAILLADAKTISTGAISALGATNLIELYLGYLDPNKAADLDIKTNAFPSSLPNLNLFLRPAEFAIRSLTNPNVWRQYTVKNIYEYK